MAIPRETIEKIQSVVRIEEVVGDYVSLRKRGANLIGLCYFHKEKTGSFTVSPTKGIYKCFGCGASGNAIKFVMEAEKCSYVDAIKYLGKKYHIEVVERQLTKEEQQRHDDRESMFVVNERANKWFQEQLHNTPEGIAIGLSYFRERGLREDVIRDFHLGYNPNSGNKLAGLLQREGYEEQYILSNVDTQIGTGVCGKTEDGKIYDRFRGRVIFPIYTISGKTVAFAGRILVKNDKTGKYVNSPDSIIYSKSRELYGLFQAKQEIARQDRCYLVEGQMDVISMYQAGIKNVVSSGGTALTENQINLIRRLTSNITLLFDGDKAGENAALKGINKCLKEQMNVKVVLLPKDEDPDSFVRSRNADEVYKYIEENQEDFILFMTKLHQQKNIDNDPQKRSEFIQSIVDSIACIPSAITRQVYIRDTANLLNIEERLLTLEVAKKSNEKQLVKDQKKEDNQEEERTINNLNNPIIIESEPVTSKKYENILQIMIQYGEREIDLIEGEEVTTVGEYILNEFEQDDMMPSDPLQLRFMHEYKEHCHENNFKAEPYFLNHIDQEIADRAAQLISSPYTLSRGFTQKDSPLQTEQNAMLDQARLQDLVYISVLELKYTIIELELEKLKKQLSKISDDWNKIEGILTQQRQLIQMRKQLAQALGRQ